MKFRNYFKQLAVPFKIDSDFEPLLKEAGCGDKKKKYLIHCTLKNTRNALLAVLPTKLLVLMINLVNQLFFIGKKIQSIDLLK